MITSSCIFCPYILSAIGLPFLALVFLYVYCRATCGRYTPRRWPNLSGKVTIVTGSNIGIGYETVKVFARLGATVIMACRSQDRAEAARTNLIRELSCEPATVDRASLAERIKFVRLDLASFASIREFVTAFSGLYPRLDILVNNAGMMTLPTKEQTVDGLEMQIGVNHFGHFLLTNLLLSTMKRSAPARVVVVSSMGHQFRGLDLDDLNFERRTYSPLQAYASSKVANVLFAAELARRLRAEGVQDVTVNSLHPGYVRTELARYMPLHQRLLVVIFGYLLGKSAEEGAQTSLYCALSDDLEGVSGKYFADCRMKQPSHTARDENVARRLWEMSERITGLSK